LPFTVYTPRNYSEQQDAMWVGMGYDQHIRLIERRSILPVFPKYLSPRSTILEAGCGFGGWVCYLNEQGYRAVGVDLNATVLGEADRRRVPLCRADVAKLCFSDESFDAYLSLGVIEHFPDGPMAALGEARRVLRPGGHIFVSTPTTNLFRNLVNHPVRRVFDIYHRLRGRQLHFAEYRFTKRELIEHVGAAGFEILETVPNDTRLDQHEYSIGFFTDWPPLRSKEKFRLNALGRVVFRTLKALSPYLIVSGILVVGRKPAAAC
jgi:SAM-dependent methyltransferase